MRTRTTWAVLVVIGAVSAAEPTDPKTLAVPVERTKEAAALVGKLDDDDVLARDRVTEQLRAMGRDALPAMEAALTAKPANRVLDRLAVLLPAARKADLDVRAKCFLADKDRKYEHDLSGWNELRAAVKDTTESRLLMADILGDDDCRAMLAEATDSTEAGRRGFEMRWEVRVKEWSDEYGASILAGKPNPYSGPRPDGPIHWMPAALLADLVCGRDYHTDFRHHVVVTYLGTDEGKLAAAGKGRYGPVVRAFAAEWVGRQEGRWGLRDAQLIATYFKLDESALRGAMEKQFELFVSTGQSNGSLSQLSSTKDSKYIPSIRRLFDVKAKFGDFGPMASAPLAGLEVRDAALSMCIALSGQDPTDYGFSAEIAADAKSDLRYDTYNYYFEDGDGKTADEKRKAAFEKWAEWEKANPDKIKAKPPEKKEK